MNKILDSRPMSGFPVSIGTSLSLETIFDPIQDVYDPNREVPEKIDTSKYEVYLFNISTLLRNLITSIRFEDLLQVKYSEILDTLYDEIDWIENAFMSNDLIANFYVHDYAYIKNNYKNKNVLRTPSTEKQLTFEGIKNYCLDDIIKQDDVHLFHKNIKIKANSVLIFTHIPFDLLSYGRYSVFDLLESNTGKVKTRKDWYTKYYPLPKNTDMSFIPLTEYLLAEVFGDHHMFHPANLNERFKIYDQLKRLNVNPLMTETELGLKMFKIM